jgi:hypothetical protein
MEEEDDVADRHRSGIHVRSENDFVLALPHPLSNEIKLGWSKAEHEDDGDHVCNVLRAASQQGDDHLEGQVRRGLANLTSPALAEVIDPA